MFDGFLDQAFSGLANGSIYACLALALVMIHTSTHHINFAQGEMALMSTYLGWALIQIGTPYWVAFFLTVGVSMAAGALIERALIRYVDDKSTLSVIVVFIGLLIFINSLAGLIFDHTTKTVPSPFDASIWKISSHASAHQIGMLAVIGPMLLAIYLFFRFSTLGLKMRAAAQNPVSSRLIGINVGAMLSLGWGLAAGIGAVAGMMTAPVVYLDPSMMTGVLIYALAGALLGGISNPWGAVVGGLLLGLIETLAGAYLVGTELRLTLALVVIVLVLLVRPNGLFGKAVVVRV
ncbi:MAG: branched-chain amino acid ABC transporter permease [Burkholderiaceae bacterium]|nr:branched-chain amino acid ABC transporter permease [Burkholderiaceae bacterium]